jgi:hypothetical protein
MTFALTRITENMALFLGISRTFGSISLSPLAVVIGLSQRDERLSDGFFFCSWSAVCTLVNVIVMLGFNGYIMFVYEIHPCSCDVEHNYLALQAAMNIIASLIMCRFNVYNDNVVSRVEPVKTRYTRQ